MNVSLSRRRVGTTLTLATVVCLISTGVLAPSIASGRVPSTERIQNLAKNAYIWGLAPEFVYRFEKYNDLVTTPRNTLGGGSGVAAAWNNNATNAGDASVLYLNAMLDLSGKKGRGRTKELVLTVPPSQNDYYVVNLLDAFINSVGSIGTRTTPSTEPQTYLLAGPTSRYAHRRTVRIRGFRYRVMTSDTNLNWMLIRIRADSLVPASNPASTASIMTNVVKRFGMSTLRQFEANRHQPNYFEPNQYTPTSRQKQRAKKWHNAPQNAVPFFEQVGQSLKLNPLPTARTGLNGIPLKTLPSWVVPQAGAKRVFRNPAFGQKRTLARFKPIGLTANGFKIPRGFGKKQLTALQNGFQAGIEEITDKLSAQATIQTNYWSYLNAKVGTYANTHQGYIYRAVIVQAGGSANMPEDAVYAQINNLGPNEPAQLDGNNTYRLTFKPPDSGIANLPAIGTLPPTVNDGNGDPRGFWSIHVYQTDPSQSAAPFITQASVLNTSYSTADVDVTAVDQSTDTLTVKPSPWGPLLASTPVLFGPTAAQYGLTLGLPYYLVKDATQNPDGTYSFQVSTQWQQDVSAPPPSGVGGDVPIQGANGTAGSIVQLQDPGGAVNLQFGPIQPVSQLGSQQLTSGRLARNNDGSVTIWIAPTLPSGAAATNWIPTPSAAYYESIYKDDPQATQPMPTNIRPLIRIYYPTPGNTPPSILPPPNGQLQATYVFPNLEKVN